MKRFLGIHHKNYLFVNKNVWNKIGKWTAWILGSLVGIVVLSVVLLYIPAVQDVIVDKVLKSVNSGGDMKISASRVRLKFPLRVEVDDFVMTQLADTTVTLSHARTRVAVMPLLRGKIVVDNLTATDAVYSMGGPDSTMSLNVKVDNFNLWSSSVVLKTLDIDLSRAELDGARIDMAIRRDTVPVEEKDTASTTSLHVLARDLSLKNIDFTMSMEGSVDTLSANVKSAKLLDGEFDLSDCDIRASQVVIDSVSARYIFPEIMIKSEPLSTDSVSVSQPWTVAIDNVKLAHSDAVYAMSGAVPQPGLDFNYLAVSEIDIEIDSFYNRATEVRVPLKRLHARERCGVQLDADGFFGMDSMKMEARDFLISTGFSQITLDAVMGMGDLATDKSLPIELVSSAKIAPVDINMMMPALRPIINKLPPYADLSLVAEAKGTSGNINIEQFRAELPRCVTFEMSGDIINPMDINHISGNLNLDGRIVNGNVVKRSLIDAKLGKTLNIPSMALRGNVAMNDGTIDGRIKAVTDTGTIALDAVWNNRREFYDASVICRHFPVEAFLPTIGVKNLSAEIDVKGMGYNPLSVTMDADAKIDLKSVEYNSRRLTDIVFDASLHDGNMTADISSLNPEAKFTLNVSGRIAPTPYDVTFSGDVDKIDLLALGLAKDKADFAASFTGKGVYDAKNNIIDAGVDFHRLAVLMKPSVDIDVAALKLDFHADTAFTGMKLTNHDLVLDFTSPAPLDSVVTRMGMAMDTLSRAIANYSFDVYTFQQTLPRFEVDLNAGKNNVLRELLKPSDISFETLDMHLANDSLIRLKGYAHKVVSGSTRLDTLTLDMHQMGRYLTFDVDIDNAPGTLDAFAHVCGQGYITGSKFSVLFNQRNLKGDVGFRFGATAAIADSILTLNLVPYDPIIGYKPWTINSDNFISLDIPKKHIDANLTMKSEESLLRLYTEHNDTFAGQEDIILNVSDVKIADWIAINPFAPSIKGNLSANMRLRQDADKMINGVGTISLDNFFYGRERVGSFRIDADLKTNARGYLTADLDLLVDSVKTITAYGSINDSTRQEPFLLDFRMIKFPLSVVNPFLPPSTARLAGTLNGVMDITGSTTSPVFNGYLDFDSATMLVNMLGTTFRFSDEKIPVDSNVVRFDNFTISGVNENPLIISGDVDMRHLIDPLIDLKLKANEMQIVGSTKPRRGADIYGKAFVDIDADVNGSLEKLNADAAVSVLSGTNVTYVLGDAQSVLQSRSTGDMVKFVNFADTASLLLTDTISPGSVAMNIDAILTIQPGTTVNVDLSADGKNKVSIKGNGTLNYSMNQMNDSRFTGRFNITGGFARYTPPLMSEKLFNFEEGSYVAFNGDMMNPILNIHAVDNLKANVTQTGQNSRLITFNIGLGVTGTLERMDVAFDLSTRDDITIQNELQSMSAEQRANQAMNLLLYNVYTGPGTKATSSLGGNPLYSFLESQLNSWAANTIKGVDLSFGINQYDRTSNGATSTATSYSYRVSKSLFNDRFKIVVGGNYTDDTDPDQNIAEDLINDISFEYMLNKSGTMVIRIFRHTGFESILEGEITQTGIGFVYKRKIQSLGDMFKPFRSSRNVPPALPQQGKVINPAILPSDDEEKK